MIPQMTEKWYKNDPTNGIKLAVPKKSPQNLYPIKSSQKSHHKTRNLVPKKSPQQSQKSHRIKIISVFIKIFGYSIN